MSNYRGNAFYMPLIGLFLCFFALLSTTSCQPTGSKSEIEWANIVHIHGITYLASPENHIQADNLGPLFDTVKFHVAGQIYDPHYQLKDGDATILPLGTSLYSVKGYQPTSRLAAQTPTGIILFEVQKSK